MERYHLDQLMGLPLDLKIHKTDLRIREWVDHWDGNVVVSFSGGLDSTVLLHRVRTLYPDIKAVFFDTGLEFPEIRDFVRSVPNVDWVRPKLTFLEVIQRYGYPVVSKEQSEFIYQARHTNSEYLRRVRLEGKPRLQKDGRKLYYGKISERYKYLLQAPFEISSQCCYKLKKNPAARYSKETGTVPFLGMRVEESALRRTKYLREGGCNSFDAKKPTSQPIAFWSHADVREYLARYSVPYSPIYDMGYERTGCMFCMYGVQFEPEPNRFQRMKG